MNKNKLTLAAFFAIATSVVLVFSFSNDKQDNPFKEQAYIDAKEYVTTELVNHPVTLTLPGCINGVSFTLAGMDNMAEQYIKDFPECTKALLRVYSLKAVKPFKINQ